MFCHVCSRPPDKGLQFHCSTCARNQLYPLRLDHAKALLEKECAGHHIETAVNKGTDDRGLPDAKTDPTRWSIQAAHTRSSQSAARTHLIQDRLEILRGEIREGKEEIVRSRAVISQKRSDAESANYRLSDRRAARVSEVQSEVKKTEQKWNNLHHKTAESRVFLCREVANLYGLRQKTRRRNGALLNTYALGGISIVDLRDLNNASPTHITTSIGHVAHLLVLVSHYLSLRLPAEITLPHRGYPLPTVFPPAASYISGDHSFPGITPSHSSSTSPTASRTVEAKPLPRPRPLFLNRSLPKLAKEDPATYTLFLEAVSLLAWDVAWVCKTQGLTIGSDSWEDVCDIGRNLWHLLLAPPSLSRALSSRDQQARPRDVRDVSRNATVHRTNSSPKLGHWSHGSAHSFLGNAEGTEYMRTWKFPSPVKIADKLKSVLLSEMTNAEWELVEENEWDDGGIQAAQSPKPVDDGAERADAKNGTSNGDTNSTVTARTESKDEVSREQHPPTPNSRPKGTSGWTKVKNR